MTTKTLLPDPLSPDVLADAEAVIEARLAQQPIDPEVLRRVRERARRITADLRERHGLLAIGVPAIRGLRDA
jgi:hypothetical protein